MKKILLSAVLSMAVLGANAAGYAPSKVQLQFGATAGGVYNRKNAEGKELTAMKDKLAARITGVIDIFALTSQEVAGGFKLGGGLIFFGSPLKHRSGNLVGTGEKPKLAEEITDEEKAKYVGASRDFSEDHLNNRSRYKMSEAAVKDDANIKALTKPADESNADEMAAYNFKKKFLSATDDKKKAEMERDTFANLLGGAAVLLHAKNGNFMFSLGGGLAYDASKPFDKESKAVKEADTKVTDANAKLAALKKKSSADEMKTAQNDLKEAKNAAEKARANGGIVPVAVARFQANFGNASACILVMSPMCIDNSSVAVGASYKFKFSL